MVDLDGPHAIAGGLSRFTNLDVVIASKCGNYVVCRKTLDAVVSEAFDRNAASKQLDKIIASRPNFAGLNMTKTHVMGIVNVTPDSFSDGGKTLNPTKAINAAKLMFNSGASIIDIGGESTRPGASPITKNQELARILPPIAALAREGITISIDTRHASVMSRALDIGANIVNDVQALRNEGTLEIVARRSTPVVMMHMQGTPNTMQRDPQYNFAPIDIYKFLERRIEVAREAGVLDSNITIDPGFGFGKTLEHICKLLIGLLYSRAWS